MDRFLSAVVAQRLEFQHATCLDTPVARTTEPHRRCACGMPLRTAKPACWKCRQRAVSASAKDARAAVKAFRDQAKAEAKERRKADAAARKARQDEIAETYRRDVYEYTRRRKAWEAGQPQVRTP